MRYFLVAVSLLLLICKQGVGQTQLETPIISSISYNEFDKKYILSWHASDYDVVRSFNILVFNGNDNTDFDILDSVPKTVGYSSYDYSINSTFTLKGKTYDLSKSIVYFVVQAVPYSTSVKASGLASWSLGNAPCNIVLEANFDSDCYYTINLNWNKFKGWAADVRQFYTLTCRDEEGNVYKINPDGANRLTTNELIIYTDTSINLPDVKKKDLLSHNFGLKPNKKYYFQVSVISLDGDESLSNVIEVNTKTPKLPDFINTYGTATFKDSVQVKYFIGPSDYSRYALFRSENYNGNFECIDTVTFHNSSTENVISFSDIVKALEKPFYYKVQLLNNCSKGGVVLKESAPESSVILTAKPARNDVQLSWTEFKGFSNFHYLLHKVAAGTETSETFNSSQTSVTESLNLLPDQGTEIVVQFWVDAVREDQENIGGKATSNIAFYTVAKNLVMQEYFTPNGDGKNDVFFVPLHGLLTQEFKLVIYDRWGMKVYETSNAADVWNGRYNNTGNLAPQGGYIYYFKIKLPTDEPAIEQKGSFFLMLPK